MSKILADIFVTYFTEEINIFLNYSILMADILADLTEIKNKKGPFKSFFMCPGITRLTLEFLF
jgi:hypothetical protein